MLAIVCFLITWVRPPRIPFSIISTMFMSVSSSIFAFVIFNIASFAKLGVETKYAGSN